MSIFAVQIEELVLDGFNFSPAEGRRLARLAESALARLLDQRGTVLHLPTAPLREGQQQKLEVASEAKPERLAEQIAEALYRALDRMS
jgi:hypothetical protein